MGKRKRGGPHGVLIVDKPMGPTSHDVVQRVRRALATRRVGHCGTLDPMATGVLVIAIGEGTKLVPYLTAADKRYSARILLGTATDTLDMQGETVASAPVPALRQEQVQREAERFVGTHPQQVPRVSAVKIDGKRAHALARDGEDFVPPTRDATLHSVSVQVSSPRELEIDVEAAKGFYVRSFARDLAARLDTLGHLVALRRHQSGVFSLEHAVALDEVEPASLMSLEDAVRLAMPTLSVDETQAIDIGHGRSFDVANEDLPEECAEGAAMALLADGVLLAIARWHEGKVSVDRGFPLAARLPDNPL